MLKESSSSNDKCIDNWKLPDRIGTLLDTPLKAEKFQINLFYQASTAERMSLMWNNYRHKYYIGFKASLACVFLNSNV